MNKSKKKPTKGIKNICPHGIDRNEIRPSFAFAGAVSRCECCGHFYGHFCSIGSERCYQCRDEEFEKSLSPARRKLAKFLKEHNLSSGSSYTQKIVK